MPTLDTSKYNTQQKLVAFSEIVHQIGIRHGGLCGSLCEDFFILNLKRDIPALGFCRGQIILEETPKIIASPQYDVIIFDNNYKENKISAFLPTSLTNAIPIKYVLGVIEVKKWSSKKMFERSGGLRIAIDKFRDNVDKKKPYFFVSFRIHDGRHEQIDLWNAFLKKIDLKNEYCYCFYGSYSTKGKHPIYPWDEEGWEEFKTPYSSKYKELTDKIIELCPSSQ